MLQGSSKKINITPPIGFNMAGYGERKHGSTGILNELYANILVLADANHRKLALVTIDVAGVDLALVMYVRQVVSEKSDIPIDAVMICASHTHSGPEASRAEGMKLIRKQHVSELEYSYYHILRENIANGILWANDTLEPITLGFYQTPLDGLGSNRIDPSLYYDNTVTVLRVDRLDKTPLAIFSQFSCHPTILNADNYWYSGDFVSFYQEEVEKVFSGCVAMFAQGCAGNTSTRHYRKGYGVSEAQRMGRLLAGEVIKSAMLVDTSDQITLFSAVESLKLVVRDFEADEVYEKIIADAEAKIEQLKKEDAPENIQRTAYVEWEGAVRPLKLKKMLTFDSLVSEMQLFKIGDWKIITTPAETFGEIGREIRKLDPTNKLTVTGYTNDSVGYIPDLNTFKNPVGYEVNSALFKEDTEQLLIKTAQKLLNR